MPIHTKCAYIHICGHKPVFHTNVYGHAHDRAHHTCTNTHTHACMHMQVDDDGKLLAAGTPSASPSDPLPNIAYRRMNYKMVQGSKYAEAAEGV